MDTTTLEFSVKRLVKFNGPGSLKAFCDLVIGDWFVIKGLRVVNGKHGLFVSMPRQQDKSGKWYDSVETLSKQARQEVERIVLEAYQQDEPASDNLTP